MAKVPGFRYGTVIANQDSKDLGLITVNIGEGEIIEAFPLLPKTFYIKPKIGEEVFLFFSDATNPSGPAGYLGPIISQDHKLYFDEGPMNPAKKGFENRADVSPATYPKDFVNRLLPENDKEIVVRGRKGSEMHFMDDAATINAGVRKSSNDNQYGMVFNSKNPAFAKFKYHYTPIATGVESTATIVADRINLLSTNSRDGKLNLILANSNELITDDMLKEVEKECYRLPYGEKLVELLNIIIDTLLTHTHPFSMMPPTLPDGAEIFNKRTEYLANNGLLSDGIRIN
jgi:hypothetical protein